MCDDVICCCEDTYGRALVCFCVLIFFFFLFFVFFFNDTATTEIYTLSLHDALPISIALEQLGAFQGLTTPEKYFYLGENLSHTPGLTRVVLSVTSPNSDVVENFNEAEELFSNLLISLAIAHAQVYLLDNESYRPYLTSAYVEAVSVEPTKLHLLRSIPDEFN